MAASRSTEKRSRPSGGVKSKPFAKTDEPTGLLLGVVGVGKTTFHNAICDLDREAGLDADSCTTKNTKARTKYKNLTMCLYDTPGMEAHVDVWKHSMIQEAALTYEPLNTIFICVQWDARINNKIVDVLGDNMTVLKEEHWKMVVPIITKMDHFKPDAKVPDVKAEKRRIKKYIREAYDCIEEVLFYADGFSQITTIFMKMHAIMSNMPKTAIKYSNQEKCIHFNLKTWQKKDRIQLKQMENKIAHNANEHIQGLIHYRDESSVKWELEFEGLKDPNLVIQDVEFALVKTLHLASADDVSLDIWTQDLVFGHRATNPTIRVVVSTTEPDSIRFILENKWTFTETFMHFVKAHAKDRDMDLEASFKLIGIKNITEAKSNSGDMSEVVFSAIQQNHAELEDIKDTYVRKYCGVRKNYEDWAAYMEITKLVKYEEEAFRKKAKDFLNYDPDDLNDWRNCIRRCCHCGIPWVKVEACDGGTTCGNLPFEKVTDDEVGALRWIGKRLKNGLMKWTRKQEIKKPEVSVGFELQLSGVKNVGTHFPTLKYVIAESLETEKSKVQIDITSEESKDCTLQVDVYTRDPEKLQTILQQESLFQALFISFLDGYLPLEVVAVKNIEEKQCRRVRPKKAKKKKGCGKSIVWRDLARVSEKDISNFLAVGEFQEIVKHINEMETFKRQFNRMQNDLTEEQKFEAFYETELSSDDENIPDGGGHVDVHVDVRVERRV